MVTLENDVVCGECIEIKVRGPEGTGMACFYFIEELLGIVQVVRKIAAYLFLNSSSLFFAKH